MAGLEDTNLIRITHYINPHMFWFKYESSFLGNTKFYELDNKIQEYFIAKQQKLGQRRFQPLLDEMIGVYNFSWNRWIRAKVDHILEFTSSAPRYIVWAVDYGVPLQTETRWIRELPVEFAEEEIDLVHFGGIGNIVPAEKTFNFVKNCAAIEISEKWSPLAVKLIEDLINDAASIKFTREMKSKEGQSFGNLEITTHTNQIIKANIVLLDTNQATTTNEFFKIVRGLGTNCLPRWQTNEGNTHVFKYHSNKVNTEKIKYDAKPHDGRRSDGAKSEIDHEIEKKVTDWEQRNQECQYKDEVTIDDISFNDSASVAIGVSVSSSAGKAISKKEMEEQAYKVAGSSRKKRLEKYKSYVPKPPTDSNPLPSVAKELKQVENGDISLTKEESSTMNSSQAGLIDRSDTNLIDSPNSKANESSDGKSAVSSCSNSQPAVSSRVAKLLNKRKSVQAKLSQMPDNVIPAGYDLRNLQPTKEDKQSKNRSFQSSSSESKGTTDLSNSMSKASISYQKVQSKQSYKPLEELDESCVPSNLSSHLVLVHGKHVARPIEKLANANFCEDVHRELANMRLNNIYRIQAFAWPHLMRGNSLVIINGARTGKTMSYLPAICTQIKMKFDDNRVPDGVGPIGIIVASSSVEVEKIVRICKRFFSSCPRKLSIVESYGIRNKERAMSYLLNGCEILVSTPPALARLLSDKLKLFDTKRIQHLVIDNIDLMHDELRSDLHLILRKCCSLNKNNSKTPVQMVITTRSWHPLVNGFLKICNNPQLCIGAYIEAAVYAQSKFKIKLIEKQSKIQETFGFLKNHPYTAERTVIICTNDEDVLDVSEALKSASFFFISVSGRSTADEIELVSEWHYKPVGDMSLLVCTDSVLPELKVGNAQNLIHYSLPSSWSRFTFRYSSVFAYYEDLLKEDDEPKKQPAVSLILLDENNNSQLPKLIEFLQKHNCANIPKEIVNLSNRIKIQREEARISKGLEFCSFLLQFGKCWNQSDCKYRHVLTKFDAPPDNLPTEGTIKVKILNVVSPTHYCVRLLEHKSSKKGKSWQKIKNSNNYLKFSLEFSEYFSDFDNHQTHWPIKVNDLCVAIEMKTFYRCKILEVPTSSNNKLTNDINLRVKLVDFGRIIPCKSCNILVLPERFKSFPFQAVDLRLADVVPYDFEQQWDSKTTETVKQWIIKYMKPEVHVRASINFILMDTIWVDNIILMEELKSISSNVYGINIKNSLLEKQFATINTEAIEIITEMARECGILNKSENQTPPSTAVKSNYQDESSLDSSRNLSTSTPNEINGYDLTTSSNVDTFAKLSPPKKKNVSSNTDDSEIAPLIRKKLKKRRIVKKSSDSKKAESSIIHEKWEVLPENEFTRVFVGSFYTPNNFYVQIINNIPSMEELDEEIGDFVALKKLPLKDPKIGLNCLAKYNGKYNRGKIAKVVCDPKDNNIKASVFFCDFGTTQTHSMDEIIHSSSQIVNFLPFQAIKCKLTGVTSTTNGIWTEEICDRIYDEIFTGSQYLYVRPVKTHEPKLDADLRFWRYEVLMIDCTTEKDEKLNEKIVEKGLAEYDPETEHFLDLILNTPAIREESSDVEEVENWDDMNYVRPLPPPVPEISSTDLGNLNFLDVDVNFTEEEALKLLNLPPSAKILPPIQETDQVKESRFTELDNKSKKSNLNGSIQNRESNISSSSTTSRGTRGKKKDNNVTSLKPEFSKAEENYPLMPRLHSMYKSPQVSWQQSESLICLHIKAPDIQDYYLKVTSTDMVFSTSIEQEINMVILNFLGGVEAELTSHEIRGLSVVIRLVKSLKGFTWPRLTWEEDKPVWLKYNYDAIVVKDKQVPNSERKISWDSYSLDDSSSVGSDSDIGYDALSENENAERIFDPLAEDFD